MDKLIYAWLYFQILISGCGESRKLNFEKDRVQVKKIGKLPAEISENSGLLVLDSVQWLIHNDGGNPSELFWINKVGEIKKTKLLGIPNQDWEDITKDNFGNVYLGDFGNNNNNRKELQIYKLNTDSDISILKFGYEPPEPKASLDCEAFFWYNHRLYLFSKNRNKENKTYLYSLPDEAGSYKTAPEDMMKSKLQITAAALNPNQKEFALLSYGKILTFEIENQQINFNKPKHCIPFKHKQTEAMDYLDSETLIITNEQGQIFSVQI